MADHEDDLQMALRMSMQNSPPEPKRSKPRDAEAPTGLPGESSEVKTRRLQRELMATAAEKRMLDARSSASASSPGSVSGSAGSVSGSGSGSASNVVMKDKKLGAEAANLGQELSEEDAKQLFSMVFGAEVSKGILAQWSNQGIRCVQHSIWNCGLIFVAQSSDFYVKSVNGDAIV